MKLAVSEIFGPTFQGEGPSLGRQATFLRLGGCNLACSWCDTPYTWDWQNYDPKVEMTGMTLTEVEAELDKHRTPLLVISGGEPMLQQDAIAELLARGLWQDEFGYHRVEIETNGTIEPKIPQGIQYNVSPKLISSGQPEEFTRFTPGILALYATQGAIFKFVVIRKEDFNEIENIVDIVGIDSDRVWIMPEGTEAETILWGLEELAEVVLERGWNLTPRLQTLIWGSARGK